MRATEIVQRLLAVLCTDVHQRRIDAVCRAVVAIVRGGRATLTGIGRSMDGRSAKHLIKAADRLLGNVLLHRELLLFYVALSRRVLPREGRPLLLIDWTDIGTLWAVLTVTLVTEGRGVVLYAQAHPRRCENSPKAEAACLRVLTRMLGSAKPILVSDAGFRGPWMKRVREAGWDFVGRVRGRVQVKVGKESPWLMAKSLWCRATSTPTCLGPCQLARYSPVSGNLILVGQRRRKALPNIGRRKKRHVRSAREPWVLVTSLETATAKEVVGIYKTRMRIEETFRDQKCPRFGWGLDVALTKCVKRINVLLMLTAVAHHAALLIGAVAEAANIHRRFQANTARKRRTLSLPRLAREVLHRLRPAELAELLRKIWSTPLPIATHP